MDGHLIWGDTPWFAEILGERNFVFCFTTNPTWFTPGLNLVLRGLKPANSHINYDPACFKLAVRY
jgi:hypothetical protein